MSTERIKVATGAPWERIVGYSRAVRVGNLVEVAGTAAVDERGLVVAPGNPYEQAKFIITKISRALQACNASLSDVVRTRIYMTDVTMWEAVGRAHGEAFGEILPVTTLLVVQKLIDARMVVELEATAIVGS